MEWSSQPAAQCCPHGAQGRWRCGNYTDLVPCFPGAAPRATPLVKPTHLPVPRAPHWLLSPVWNTPHLRCQLAGPPGVAFGRWECYISSQTVPPPSCALAWPRSLLCWQRTAASTAHHHRGAKGQLRGSVGLSGHLSSKLAGLHTNKLCAQSL